MPSTKVNGVNLYWELTPFSGDPLVMVHGSWGDHHNWDSVVSPLSGNFRVLTYDRRGHSLSERPGGQGSMEEDVSDLVALIEYLDLAPLHLAGNSGGAAIAIKAFARRPDLFKSLIAHEPPLFGLLKEAPEAQPILQEVSRRIGAVVELIGSGKNEEAARLFVDTIAFGPGGWQQMPPPLQQTFLFNAPTFYDEAQDPQGLDLDIGKLENIRKPVLLSGGTQSPPFFSMVLDRLMRAFPGAERKTFREAGHVPHITHPAQYVEMIENFCSTYV